MKRPTLFEVVFYLIICAIGLLFSYYAYQLSFL